MKAMIATLIALLAAACGQRANEPSYRNSLFAEPALVFAADISAPTRQRIVDLTTISHALELFHSGHLQRYPATTMGWQGYRAEFGLSLGERWIPELSPHYLSVIPRDPAGGDDPRGPQYLYLSNGRDYKLIVANAVDCSSAVETGAIRIDPKRVRDGACTAYGVWSAGGVDF